MSDSVFHEEEYNKQFDLSVWRKALRYAIPYRRYVIGLSIVMIIVGGIDAIFPLLTLHAIDDYVVPGNLSGLSKFAWLYIVIVAVQGINVWLLIALAGKIDMWVCYDIRQAGFTRLQELSFSYFDQKPVGWLMAQVHDEIFINNINRL